MDITRLIPLVILVTLTGCGDAGSPEQQVRQVLEQIEAAVDSRDTGKLVQHLSAEYRDANGRSREEAIRYVRAYVIAHHSVSLMPVIKQIEFPLPDEARARGHVVMLAGEADAAGNWDQDAASYDIELSLRQEDGEWKLSFARWSRTSASH